VLHEQGVERDPVALGEPGPQPFLGLLRRAGPNDSQPVRDPVDVGIDRDGRDSVAEDEDAIRGLRTDPGKGDELLERVGNLSGEPVEYRPSAGPEGPRLLPVESDDSDERLDLRRGSPRERRSIGIPREEPGRRDVGLLVAGPLGKNRSDQHLERVLGMIPQIRGPPIPYPVERRETVQEELPVEFGRTVSAHGALRGEFLGRTEVGSVPRFGPMPGSERSGSSASWADRTSSPTR
jgi:hypothetical protein